MRRDLKVPVAEKWRLSLQEAAALCGVSENYVRDEEQLGRFPPRVPARDGGAADGTCKLLYVAREVKAFADGLNWRALVAERTGVAHAS